LPVPTANLSPSGCLGIEPERIAAMKLSTTAHYAVGALVYMAVNGEDRTYFSPEIARGEGFPAEVLREALKYLVHAGVLQSLRGSRGGYRLTRRLRDVSLLEVIEAIDGPIRGEGLPWMGQVDSLDRRLHEVCERCAADARQVLRRVRVGDLAPGTVG
jgi:Rrf2 family protein